MEQKTEIQEKNDKQAKVLATVTQTPKWLVIVLLLFFPPAAWYFMWKEERYHKWFAYVLRIYGGLMSFVAFAQVVFVLPKILKLYEDFGADKPTLGVNLVYILFAVSLAQVIYGIFLWKKVKATGKLSRNLLIITIIILTFDFLVMGFSQVISTYSAISPIYNLTSQL